MIDLGIDLDGFDDDEPARPARPGQPRPRPRSDGGATIPLADLQAAGFNTTDPHALTRAMLQNVVLDDDPVIYLAGTGGAPGGTQAHPGGAGAGGSARWGVTTFSISPRADGIDPDIDEALGDA